MMLDGATSLRTLDLRGNALGSGGGESPDEATGVPAARLARLFRRSHSLTEIDISANRLGAEGSRAACEVLSSCAGLRCLRLADNAMGDASCLHLIARLQEGHALTELDVAHNRLTQASALPLIDLVDASAMLCRLDVRAQPLGRAVGEGLSALALRRCDERGGMTIDGIALAPLLAGGERVLSYEGMRLGVHDGVMLGALLSAASTNAPTPSSCLRTLQLRNNALGEEGAVRLVQSVLPSVEDIDLSDNALGADGAIAVIGQLQDTLGGRLGGLRRLALNSNGLGHGGGQAAVELLRQSSSLTACELRSNLLPESVGRAIATLLRDDARLVTLDMRDNPHVGEGTGRALLAALETNSTLEMVNGLELAKLRGIGLDGGAAERTDGATRGARARAAGGGGGKGGGGHAEGGRAGIASATGGAKGAGGAKRVAKGSARAAHEASSFDPPAVGLAPLELSSMQMGLVEALIIGKLVAGNRKASALLLDSNALGDEAACQLLGLLSANETLTYLSLRANGISRASSSAIAAFVEAHTTLRVLVRVP